MNHDEKFVYNYSSKQQKEIEQIREKYLPKKVSKLDEMRKLDQAVTRKASIITILFGIISTLFLGLGMCCTMVWEDTLFLPGIVIGVIGLIGMGATLPLYTYVLKRERGNVAQQMLRLSDEVEHENAEKESDSDHKN